MMQQRMLSRETVRVDASYDKVEREPTMTEQDMPQEEANWADSLDRSYRAMIAEMTQGVAPSTLALATMDWAMHLSTAPGKLLTLGQEATKAALDLASHAIDAEQAGEAMNDPRFQSEGWNTYPFHLYRNAFLASEQWWLHATTGVRGVSKSNEDVVSFAARQMLDMVSPSNNPLINPDIVSKSVETLGANFTQGAENALEDIAHHADESAPPASLLVGKDLATTPGKVVARNHLMELIQYEPVTETVRPEPVLIVPAWIMKYYILDLTPRNSFVRYLLSQGFTVFVISWRNPTYEDRDIGMDDYVTQGPMAALDAIEAITGTTKTHAIGYCLGGTLLTIAAAAMARDGVDRLATMTLLAAQADFSEAGELKLFISEAQVTLLEDMMREKGFLDGEQMLGAFTMLRSNDLLWSRMVHEFFMGEKQETNDLMAWNADATRMPARMHSEYLRDMFLENKLSYGKYRVGGRPISLTDLRLPILAVGTESDHVAPWKSAFKIHHLTESEITFILTSGGHNAGIVSEPGHKHRHYRIATTKHDATFRDADTWMRLNPPREGSWWPELAEWFGHHSGEAGPTPPMGNAQAGYAAEADAPGSYVLIR
jgi:polyhydroxyalkanoate synthase subunit PhaC